MAENEIISTQTIDENVAYIDRVFLKKLRDAGDELVNIYGMISARHLKNEEIELLMGRIQTSIDSYNERIDKLVSNLNNDLRESGQEATSIQNAIEDTLSEEIK